MSWWALIPAAISAVGGLAQQANANSTAGAQDIVNEANAYASNLMRGANNKLKAARGSLARYNQAVNNQRTLENAGREAEAAVVNYRRARDSASNDDFESQIAFAEQAGAQGAAAAFSGLSGGVADMVASTTALRKARLQQRSDEAMRQGDFDASRMQANIMQSGWDSLDHSEISEDLDYGYDVAVKAVPSGNILSAVLGGQSAGSLKGVSNFFSSSGYDAFADRAGSYGSGSGGRSRTITGGR